MVSTPGGGQLTVTASVRRATEAEFTIIALPDTQHYSEAFPAVFTSQTQWIKDNTATRNIVFVTHEGDLVQNANVNSEWVAANAAMSLMDGVVPYGMAPGNHDQPTTLFNTYFPYTRYEGLPWYGGHYQSNNDNNYQLFSGGGMDFVIVHVNFCAPPDAVSWASGVLNSFPNRIGMMTTHAYLNLSAQRTTHVCGSTQFLWDDLALPSPNLHFMLSGHVHGESRRTDIANGHPVFQMLADYQDRPSGGNGWLRILRFVPADDMVYVQTYSPWLNQYETDADSEFTLDFPMGGSFTPAGTTVAASGSTASMTPSELEPNTEYEWQVTVTNANGKSRTGPIWRFTTGANVPVNQPPVAVDDAYSVPAGTMLQVGTPGVLKKRVSLASAATGRPRKAIFCIDTQAASWPTASATRQDGNAAMPSGTQNSPRARVPASKGLIRSTNENAAKCMPQACAASRCAVTTILQKVSGVNSRGMSFIFIGVLKRSAGISLR
jgi:hypothetical protein